MIKYETFGRNIKLMELGINSGSNKLFDFLVRLQDKFSYKFIKNTVIYKKYGCVKIYDCYLKNVVVARVGLDKNMNISNISYINNHIIGGELAYLFDKYYMEIYNDENRQFDTGYGFGFDYEYRRGIFLRDYFCNFLIKKMVDEMEHNIEPL